MNRWKRWAILAAAGVALISAIPVFAAAWDLLGAKRAFSAGVEAVGRLEVAEARGFFAVGKQRSAEAEAWLERSLALPLGSLPPLESNLQAAGDLARGGQKLALAADTALETAGLFPVGPDGPHLNITDGRLDLTPWPRAASAFTQAASTMNAALIEARVAHRWLMPPVAQARKQFLSDGKAAVRTLEKASDAASLLPYFFGADKPRTWFLIIQNPVEARATGGFLGAFGIMTADAGKITLEQFVDNTNLPVVDPPVEASAEFKAHYDRFGSRFFWPNSNMTPDFPTAARIISTMWEQETGRGVDGVMAIDAVGLNNLLGLVGAIDVPPIGPVDSSNFLRVALNEVYVLFPEKEDRSKFLIEVGQQVYGKVLRGEFSNPAAQLGSLAGMAEGKRLQIWSPGAQEKLEALGLAGELRPPAKGDYLLVVGQNAAGNKVDYYARRRISLSIELDNTPGYRRQVEIRTDNYSPASGLPRGLIGPFGDLSDPAGLNRSYLTLFTPGGTTLLEARKNGVATNQIEEHTERGLVGFSNMVETPALTSSTLSFTTRGTMTESGVYRLRAQHQPGLTPDALELEIVLPRGAVLLEATEGMTVDGRRVKWKGFLGRDKEFEVRFSSTRTSL